MKHGKWAEEHYKEIKDDPIYIAAGLMIEITEKFCERMDELGLSQTELARRIGKTQPYVSKILNRGTNMTLETIALFAMALDLQVLPPVFTPMQEKSQAIKLTESA